jgi:hypothetical protein
MGSKRKRSADDSPLSICSFGAVSTLEAQSPAPFPSNGWDFTSASRVKNSDWGNRTRKRFRDNRPDEHTIHGMLPTCLEREDSMLMASRKHVKQAIRRPTQPPRTLARSIQQHSTPIPSTNHLDCLKTAKIDAAFFLETTTCAARPTIHVVCSNAAQPNRVAPASLRRLRSSSAKRE